MFPAVPPGQSRRPMAPAMRFSRLMLGRVYLISLLIACKESDATVHASNPDASHTARLAPMLCVFATMIPGEGHCQLYREGGAKANHTIFRSQSSATVPHEPIWINHEVVTHLLSNDKSDA